MPDDTPDVEMIFDKVVIVEDPIARRQLLDHLCGSNLALRQRVDELLRAYDRGQYLEHPLGVTPPDLNHATLVGQQVDHYEVLELLGDGGMGEVYLARDQQRAICWSRLKSSNPAWTLAKFSARFELEKAVLRSLDHPAITRYFNAGCLDNGRAYFSMELVRGLPITEFCDRHRMSVEQRIHLLREVCMAVEHAHQNGIVHRDLKPSNILISQKNGEAIC